MFRRLTSIALLCASLLGMAQPLMACASAMAMSDCCSGDAASGCASDTMPELAAGGGSCCLATPGAQTSSWLAPSRSIDETLHGGGTTAPFHSAGLTGSDGRTPESCLGIRAADAPRATDATLTYLRTARLRL
ncbi:MAG TPA: hypothetical protein VE046_05530 [Steroidobacteraceae bacterium]|nr:hypothetical protein [Steroidobacteraceae bacterium]